MNDITKKKAFQNQSNDLQNLGATRQVVACFGVQLVLHFFYSHIRCGGCLMQEFSSFWDPSGRMYNSQQLPCETALSPRAFTVSLRFSLQSTG